LKIGKFRAGLRLNGGKKRNAFVAQNPEIRIEDESLKRRKIPDRRRKPTPILSWYSLKGNRRDIRRDEDRRRHIYVDQYSLGFFVLLMSILLLGTADAFLTLHHVHVNNAEELNPIMDFFLGLSPNIFFNVKYVLTALCLTVLCLHKNLPIVKYLLGVVFLIYFVIVLNHLYLFVLVS
jgi:hypothetical protein